MPSFSERSDLPSRPSRLSLPSCLPSAPSASPLARRPRPPSWAALASPSVWPGMSIWPCPSCCAASDSPVRAREVARRLGLASSAPSPPEVASAPLAGLACLLSAVLPPLSEAAGAESELPPAWRSLMTSISWLLRIRAVPLIPRPEATCWSSARTMPSSPVPERRRLGAAPEAGVADASVAGAAAPSAAVSAFTPIRSVVSLTKGPSLERTSASLARRPVVLSGCGPVCADLAGAVVPPGCTAGRSVRGFGVKPRHGCPSRRLRSVFAAARQRAEQCGRLLEEEVVPTGATRGTRKHRTLRTIALTCTKPTRLHVQT